MFQTCSSAQALFCRAAGCRVWRAVAVYMLVAGLVLAHPMHELFQVDWERFGKASGPLSSPDPLGIGTGGLPPVAITWVRVPLSPSSLMPGWGGDGEDGWLVPAGGQPLPPGVVPSLLPGGDPWKAQAQILVFDKVLVALARVRAALEQTLLNLGISTTYQTAAWKAQQAATHHTQQQAQSRLQHVQNIMQKTREVLAAGKQNLVAVRQLVTQRGIFAILREQLLMSDDVRKVIVTIYDIWQKGAELHAAAEEALFETLEVPSFIMDYRNWYRDANPETVLAVLENFVIAANPSDSQRMSETIRELVKRDPDMQVKVETYFSLSAQALEKARIVEELRKKISAHRQKLDKPNPATGKSEEELTVLNNRKDTPDNPPPAGSPERDTAGVTPDYHETMTRAEDELAELERKAADAAKDITEEVSMFEELYKRLMEQAEDSEEAEKRLNDFFTNSDRDNECLDPFCLALRFFYLR